MNGWWLGMASLAACGSKVPVGTLPSTTVGTGMQTGTPTGGTDTGLTTVGTTAIESYPCGPNDCLVGEYCSVVVPGVQPTDTGTAYNGFNYTCVPNPPECVGAATCACIGCGGLTGTGTMGPYLCEEIPSLGATCTMYAP